MDEEPAGQERCATHVDGASVLRVDRDGRIRWQATQQAPEVDGGHSRLQEVLAGLDESTLRAVTDAVAATRAGSWHGRLDGPGRPCTLELGVLPHPEDPDGVIVTIRDLTRLETRQRELTEALSDVAEERLLDHQLLSEAIHDGPVQELGAIRLLLDASADDAAPSLSRRLGAVIGDLRDTMTTLRKLDAGESLVAAMRTLAADAGVELHSRGPEPHWLSPARRSCVIRVGERLFTAAGPTSTVSVAIQRGVGSTDVTFAALPAGDPPPRWALSDADVTRVSRAVEWVGGAVEVDSDADTVVVRFPYDGPPDSW